MAGADGVEASNASPLRLLDGGHKQQLSLDGCGPSLNASVNSVRPDLDFLVVVQFLCCSGAL